MSEQSCVDACRQLYTDDPDTHLWTIAAAEIQAKYFGKYTRIEETVAFAKRIGAKKIGIATCAATAKEAQVFKEILEVNGFETLMVACKVGGIKKEEVGIDEAYHMGPNDCICNPVMQAKMMNEAATDLNVVVGLCVGHDTMFFKYSEAPVTVLFSKDRVTGNVPAVPLSLTHSFYRRLLQPLPEETDASS